MEYLVTFLEGVVTFVSPCLLPMLPVYVAYFAGGSTGQGEGGVGRALLCGACFVLGFTLVFVAMGAFAGALGSLLLRHQRVLEVICGAFVVAMGLGYLGVWQPPWQLVGGARSAEVAPRTPGSSVLFGLVFGVAWTPCVGTFLASALSLAASSASAGKGVALLLCYAMGLGIPFLVSAVLIDQLVGAFAWIRAHYEAINRACGVMLVVVGIAMAAGLFGSLLRLLS